MAAGAGVTVGGMGVAVDAAACAVKRASTVWAATVEMAATSGVGCGAHELIASAIVVSTETNTNIFCRIFSFRPWAFRDHAGNMPFELKRHYNKVFRPIS